MLNEQTKKDLLKAAENYNTVFPNSPISYSEMLKRFNDFSHANPNLYLAPIYDEKIYMTFMNFAKHEIKKEKEKAWTPTKESAQNQNVIRRNQMKNKSMFSIER